MFNDGPSSQRWNRPGVRPEHSWDYSIAGCEELAVGGKVFGVCRTGTVNQAQCVLDALRRNPPAFEDLLASISVNCLWRRANVSTRSGNGTHEARKTPRIHLFLCCSRIVCAEGQTSPKAARPTISPVSPKPARLPPPTRCTPCSERCTSSKVSVEALNQALAANFQGQAACRRGWRTASPSSATTRDEIDLFARDIVRLNQRVIDELGVCDYRGGRIVNGSGISTAWAAGHWTGATPDGRLRGQPVSVSLGPASGTSARAPRPC